MAEFEQALATANQSEDPPFFPPAGYKHLCAETENDRIYHWRAEHHRQFADLGLAWNWLAEMLLRLENNQPAVTAAEFYHFAAWFKAHESRLKRVHSGLLDLGGGEVADYYLLRHGIDASHRGTEVSCETAPALRVQRG